VILVVQIGGVLLLGALIGAMMKADSAVVGVSVLAVAVTGLAFWGGLWGTGRTFIQQSETYPSIRGGNVAPGSLYPADVNLLTAAELVLPRDARVYLLTAPGAVGDSPEWISYQLSPRLLVGRVQEAQYILVYGASPTKTSETAHLPIVLNRLDGGVVRTKPA
jgi:hypothetical protein